MGSLLVLSCLVMKADGKLQEPNPGRLLMARPFRNDMWVTPPGKELNEPRYLLRAKGIWEEYWKKVVLNTNYDHMTSRRNEAVIVMNISLLFCCECVYMQHL